MLRNRGVIPTTLIEQIRAQIAWQGVIQRRVRPNVEIAPEEVEEVVARLAARRGTVERRDAEIFVPIESAAQEDEAMANARRLFDERSEEHTSELQSLMRISYAVFCLKKQNKHTNTTTHV